MSKKHVIISEGKVNTLLFLLFPLLGSSFFNYLYLFIEKIFFGKLSTAIVQETVQITYVCQIFQTATVALALMCQVFVGRSFSGKEWKSVGPIVWQFIWFSLASILITFPLTLAYAKWHFYEKPISPSVLPYFYLTALTNFLYPLTITLSCFYLGQGKTRLIFILNVIAQCFKIALAHLLIFGSRYSPAYGALGGVLGNIITQCIICIILGTVFLNKKQDALFDSRSYRIQFKLFWECINVGMLKAVNRMLTLTSWAFTIKLLVNKPNVYVLVLSLGGTIFSFLTFLGEALNQAQVTMASHLIGAKKYNYLNQALRSGLIISCCFIIILSIPLVCFPYYTLRTLFPLISLADLNVPLFAFGLWLCFAAFSLSHIPLSFITAFKDMRFHLFAGLFNGLHCYALMYVALQYFHIQSHHFWTVLTLHHLCILALYTWRTLRLTHTNLLLSTQTLQTTTTN